MDDAGDDTRDSAGVWLTYDELADARAITRAAARRLAGYRLAISNRSSVITADDPAAVVPIAYVSLTLRASRRSGPEFPYRLTAIGEHYVRQYSAGDRPPRSSRAWLILPTAVLAA